MALAFYNSLSRQVEKFIPVQPGKIGLYTCGPTVYDYAHIGNFRAYVFEDILRRTLQYSGFNVVQVMNLTDVDDKTIRGAREKGKSLTEFTEVYKRAFFEDVEALRIEPAEHYPAATEHIAEMIKLIEILLAKGVAYHADDGSIYFSIARYPNYGRLVNFSPEDLRSTGRVRNDEYGKEAVADFALWKARQEEDGDFYWDSPWGQGRPGWHIECSAMSMKYLGAGFDIHTGGIDNMFPHHEDEIAQSEAATGETFAKFWLHCAHLIVEGQKMAKSLGNFFTLRDLLAKNISGREIRYVLLSAHYRQPLNFTLQGCYDAGEALRRVDDFCVRLKEKGDGSEKDIDSAFGYEVLRKADNDFRAGLEDDLNLPESLAAVFTMVRDFNRLLDQEGAADTRLKTAALDMLRKFDQVLGVLDVDKQQQIPEEVQALAESREEARKARDFTRADMFRDQLAEQGWLVEDTPAGSRLKKSERGDK